MTEKKKKAGKENAFQDKEVKSQSKNGSQEEILIEISKKIQEIFQTTQNQSEILQKILERTEMDSESTESEEEDAELLDENDTGYIENKGHILRRV